MSKPQIIFAITGKEAIVPNKMLKTGRTIFHPVSFVMRAKRKAIMAKATGIIEERTLSEIKPILFSPSAILIKEIELHATTTAVKAERRLQKILKRSFILPSGT